MKHLGLKALLGAAAVVLIQLLAKTQNYFIAGLVPLFPTFALIAHYIVGSERTVSDLRRTILFGMVSPIPYFLYLLSLYFVAGRWRLPFRWPEPPVCGLLRHHYLSLFGFASLEPPARFPALSELIIDGRWRRLVHLRSMGINRSRWFDGSALQSGILRAV